MEKKKKEKEKNKTKMPKSITNVRDYICQTAYNLRLQQDITREYCNQESK